MKNLIVNGCSFTASTDKTKTWADHLQIQINPEYYKNLAQGGAGNKFICDSTIAFCESNNLLPSETTVLIMWSGIGRKDLHISGEWYFYLKDQYNFLCQRTEESYYLHSGGLSASWLSNKQTKKTFEQLYKLSDPLSICFENLLFFIQLQSYLRDKGYNFIFTNYFNTWNPTVESTNGGDYCIGHFCTKTPTPMYDNFDFSNWYFLDNEQMCLGDLAEKINELDDTDHPTDYAHKLFAKQFFQKINVQCN